MLLALVLTTVPADLSLNLTCHGRNLASVPIETTTVYARDSHGRSASGSGVTSQLASIETSVGFRLEGGQAKIRIPAALLPPAHGGQAGWFDVKKLVVTDREITGKAAVNFLYNPSFRIDRMTGELTSSGGNHYACEAETATERKF